MNAWSEEKTINILNNSLFTHQLMSIPLFLIPIIVGGIIQVCKIVIDFSIEKSINLSSLWRAGWFPSVHSGISSSICVVIGVSTGWSWPLFALAFCVSFLFWYDAMNVRYQAGMHAKYLNDIRLELQDLLKVGQNLKFLKERLGHTFVEVMWGIVVGGLLTFIVLWVVDPSFHPSAEIIHIRSSLFSA